MGLIYADELKKELYQQWFMDILLTQRNSEDMFYALAQKIDEQPTAYDVDKVVATMDKALIELEDGTNCGTCVFKEVCDNGYDGCIQTIVAVCKSIVKAGGRDER